jgi:hypothetical protein
MMTTKEATDRAWHILTRLHGVKIALASATLKLDQGYVTQSRCNICPDEPSAKLGFLAQLLYDTNPAAHDDAHAMVFEAASAAGHPVRFHPPVLSAFGTWLDHRGQKVEAPK